MIHNRDSVFVVDKIEMENTAVGTVAGTDQQSKGKHRTRKVKYS
jgi:hypothetical protein